MFYGATPRGPKQAPGAHNGDPLTSPRTPRVNEEESSDLGIKEIDEIIICLRHSATAVDALLKGVKDATLGAERVEVCRLRRRDGVRVLRCLDDVLDKPADAWRDEDERKSKLSRVQSCLEGFQKALATLDAHERLAERACKRGDPCLQDSPRHSSPNKSPRQYGLADKGGLEPCSKLSADASALWTRVIAARGEKDTSEEASSGFWSWITCCTSRPDGWDHEATVENRLASLDRLVFNSRRGDLLVCAPSDMAVDAVRYFHAPGADGSGGTVVHRGDTILMQGRRGGWAFNKNGWLPLWHPISRNPNEAEVLFAFDHHSTMFEDDDDSDESDEPDPFESPRQSPRGTKTGSKESPRMLTRSWNR